MKIYTICHTRWEKAIFSYQRQEERQVCKTFENLQHPFQLNVLKVFFQMRNFLPRSDGELTSQQLIFSVSTRYTDIDRNQAPNIYHGKSSAALDREGNCWKTLQLSKGICALRVAGEPILGWEKISATILLLTSDHLHLQITILLIIMNGKQLNETNRTPCSN